MSKSNLARVLMVAVTLVQMQVTQGEEDLNDFAFSPSVDQEMMIAQESRGYTTVVKPPIIIHKPNGITNSHRPQYKLDSYEQRPLVEEMDRSSDDYDEGSRIRQSLKESMKYEQRPVVEEMDRSSEDFEDGSRIRQRMKESMIREAMLRALERKDHIKKFAQVLPIIRAMSGSQRVALASLVASQVSAPAHRRGLTLNQVRSMFGPETNSTSELMLPILLDMANLFRRAARAGKRPRSAEPMPQPQMLRRSFTEDDVTYDDDVGVEDPPAEESTTETATTTEEATPKPTQNTRRGTRARNTNKNTKKALETTTHHSVLKLNNTDIPEYTPTDNVSSTSGSPATSSSAVTVVYAQQQTPNSSLSNGHSRNSADVSGRSSSSISSSINSIRSSVTSSSSNSRSSSSANSNARITQNATLDQIADATNNSQAEDLPVAEKLRSWYHDRKASGGKPPRRPVWSPQPGKPHPPPPSRRGESGAAGAGAAGAIVAGAAAGARRRPAPPARKLQPARPSDQGNCELFTNSLCLEADDYPTEAILSSLRRNKAATGALLADYKEQAEGAGAVDGVTAAQEASYTADTYLNANRRGDSAGSVRDFAAAGEAGFMCPSTVKYARPQRARATSGSWKYIVNTGEHTQTLRLEKCLKPKEACTYLTDNFKSKCVQVYNYHRLLTWDQQNGLHMDIFKVPTCCSCHIEGYSVSFPPLGHRTHETSSEHFPGQDLSQETSNPFESALGQSTVPRPSVTKTGHSFNKPIESYAVFSDAQNVIPGAGFNAPKFGDADELGSYNGAGAAAMDSYGNSYFPDSFNQASAIRNVKKPPTRTQPPAGFDTGVTLPSYLEPPTRSAVQSSFFGKSSDTPNKYKYSGTQYKRAKRPGRRPIRKTASGGAEDLMPSGSSLMETATAVSLESMEDFSDLDDFEMQSQATNRISSPSSLPPSASTTEAIRTTQRSAPSDHGAAIMKEMSLNKRVNYNYHPIIDFFESSSPGDQAGANDREDNAAFSSDSEWKPMSHPLTRSNQVPKTLAHHRHK